MSWLDAFKFLAVDSIVSGKKSSKRDGFDADTLMIIAGPCGSGKTTLLQAAYKEKLPLFGADFVGASVSPAGTEATKSMMISRRLGGRDLFFRPVISSCWLARLHCLRLFSCMWTCIRCCVESTRPIGPVL